MPVGPVASGSSGPAGAGSPVVTGGPVASGSSGLASALEEVPAVKVEPLEEEVEVEALEVEASVRNGVGRGNGPPVGGGTAMACSGGGTTRGTL